MDWMIVNPDLIHNTCASLGVRVGDQYIVNEDCIDTLEEIIRKVSVEDRTLRTYRRALGFSQVIKKDLIPLLIHVRDRPKVIDVAIRLLVNLTIPVECLLPMEAMYRTESGKHTIYELNKLLMSAKDAFVNPRATRAVVDHMKGMMEHEPSKPLSSTECEALNNCLLLLRNVLHIPEFRGPCSPSVSISSHSSKQNQILWNLFSHNVDKILIHMMICSQKGFWVVTMVQLLALAYKDQHVGTLQKLLHLWLESSLSDSSEDNESNTSPPDQGSDFSRVLTSDPTSDSSESCGNSNSCSSNQVFKMESTSPERDSKQVDKVTIKPVLQHRSMVDSWSQMLSDHCKSTPASKDVPEAVCKTHQTTGNRKGSVGKKERQIETDSGCGSLSTSSLRSHVETKGNHHNVLRKSDLSGGQKKESISTSEISDCGYGTRVENQEQSSTSSNDDNRLHGNRSGKPVHQKPHTTQKLRNGKSSSSAEEKKDRHKKKIVRRTKLSRLSTKSLPHHTPTDDDISLLLREFTVDFLLRGYNPMVAELRAQLLSSIPPQMDTSHFFWLLTYFLKFAAQLELELEHVGSVLSFEILSYLTYEGVNMCEQLELSYRQLETDFKPHVRRMHLVVTAIREFVLAVDSYSKISNLSSEDKCALNSLQFQMVNIEELRNLFLLLLRHYNPVHQSKQYLQDVIITNHAFLLLLERILKMPSYKGNLNLADHIKEYATTEIIHKYGLMLEDFQNNGKFVNDCVFTMIHHVAGDLKSLDILFQPLILKSFSQIWEMEFEICDDWADLVEYVLQKFMRTTKQGSISVQCEKKENVNSTVSRPEEQKWCKQDIDSLYWYYVQCSEDSDPVRRIIELYAENGAPSKTRLGVIQQLLSQDIITFHQYEALLEKEPLDVPSKQSRNSLALPNTSKIGSSQLAPISEIPENDEREGSPSEITQLKDQLMKEGRENEILWLQHQLLEACYVKLYTSQNIPLPGNQEPVSYHFIVLKQSIPLIPWSSNQEAVLMHQPFMLLLHKLGFHLPADVGKIFPRMPHFWTADVMFSVAEKLGPITSSKVKFDIKLLDESTTTTPMQENDDAVEVKQEKSFGFSNCKEMSNIRFTPSPKAAPNWLQLVMKSKGGAWPPQPQPKLSQKKQNEFGLPLLGTSLPVLPKHLPSVKTKKPVVSPEEKMNTNEEEQTVKFSPTIKVEKEDRIDISEERHVKSPPPVQMETT